MFAVTLLVASWSVATKNQVGFAGGLCEEWFQLGWNLHRHGTFGGDPADPYAQVIPPVGSSILRPPAYPLFVAAVLTVWAPFAPAPASQERADLVVVVLSGLRAVAFAQALLLAATSALLCLWLSAHVPAPLAAAMAGLFGTCIYTVVLVGLPHPSTLVLLLAVIAASALDRALVARRHDPRATLLAGVAWGACALASPMCWPLPLALLLALLVAGVAPRLAARTAAALALGMVLTIAPWTLRNYAVTGRVIPINARVAVALWVPTARAMPRAPDTWRQDLVWRRDGLPIQRRTLRRSPSPGATYFDRVLELEEEFGREARANLAERPGVYARNAAVNFVTFNLDVSSFLVQAFNILQQPGSVFLPHWVKADAGFVPDASARELDVLIAGVALLALGAALRVRRSPAAIGPLAAYLAFGLAHTLTSMDLLDYPVKLPSLFALAAVSVHALRRVPVTASRSAGDLALVALVILSGSLTLTLLA